MHPAFTDTASNPVNIHLIEQKEWDGVAASLPEALRAFAEAQSFTAAAGQSVLMPDAKGALATILFGMGDGKDALALAALSSKLPGGDYTVTRAPKDWPDAWSAAGWIDGAYRFDRYLSAKAKPPRLVVSGKQAAAIDAEARAVQLLRDMVNTPAEDMGPDRIQGHISDLAEQHGATLTTIQGEALLKENYPMVHAVGRAGPVEPRFLELEWGSKKDPHLAIVGKGVVFDTGGLNIKGGDGMRLMKKDMGGAALAIALASLVMEAGLKVHLKLYVPAVENSIGTKAFRPSDVLQSRKGLTVEIDNTDAEGRLILADALTRACEFEPDLLVDFATLTGAARVAVGPDLAPFYTDDEDIAAGIWEGGKQSGDPVWRMPLWDPYLSDLKSPIADMQNSGGRMAGSITAALFLKQFVDTTRWTHLDVWAWRNGKYGRPAGGAACGLRAMWAMVQNRYG